MAEPIRVLIVDDEERFRDTLAKLLTRHGFQPSPADAPWSGDQTWPKDPRAA